MSSQEETTPDFEVPSDKHPKQSGPDGEVQNNLAVITMDSLERALDSLQALKGATQEALMEACASLEDGVSDGGLPDANRAVGEAPLEIAVELLFSIRLTNAGPNRLKGPDKLVLTSPVIPTKWEQPSSGAHVSGPDIA